MKTNILSINTIIGTKNNLVRYAACLLVFLCMSIGCAWGTISTWTSADEAISVKNGVTITMSNTAKGDYYQVFKSSNLEVSVSSGSITSITITCTKEGTTKYGPGGIPDGDGYKASASYTGTWTGNAASVTLTASTNQVRITQIVVETSGGCDKTVTLSYDGDAASHGEFVLKAGSASGSTISEGGTTANCGSGTTTVALCPQNVDEHYHLEASNITATNKTGSITSDGNGNFLISYTQGSNVSSSVSVTFTEDTKYTVTWSNNGGTFATTQVYDGDKPTLPANPTNCDATSNTFYGWSTAEWSGALDDVSSKTIYTDASAMPAVTANVTYYAVFAKAVKSDNFQLLTASSNFISGEDYLIESYYSSTDHVLKAANYNSKTYQQVSENSWSLPSSGTNFDMSSKSDLCIWKITSEGNNQFSIYNASADKYLVLVTVSSYNNLILSDTKDASFIRTVIKSEGYSDNFSFESSSVSGYHLACSGDYWNAYTTAEEVYLYKRVTTYSKYRTNCCTQYDITLAGSGTVTGGTIEADPTTACEGAAITLAATPSTGYNFTEWIVKDGSANDVTSDVIADGDEDESFVEMTMPDYDVTVDATFTAKEYAVVLDKNGGTSDGEATATYNSSSLTSVTHASYTGYTLLGYYTDYSGGDMVITANGALVAGVDDYTDEDGKWIYDDEALFAAHWKPTGTWGVTITAPSNGTITVTYNSGANTMTSGSAYIGGTITISAAGNTGYELATNGLKVNGTTFTSGSSLTLSEDITISATFDIQSYNVAVLSPSNVTISAGDIDEGENEDVDYGTELTLSYSSITSGHYWSGWKVTKQSDGTDVTASVVDESTLTVPTYAINVTAKIYGDVKAWCIPTFNVTGDVHLTSTAGVYVNQTADADNLINFSGSDLYNVDNITISYLDENGDVVANGSSPLRLYGSAGSSLAEGNISNSSFTSGAYNQNYSVRFTVPAATYNTVYNYKLRLQLRKLINGVSTYRVIKTIEHPMNGRALPEEFVIAVKNGTKWYALPNTLAATQGGQGSITPINITVNDNDNPTAASYASSLTVFKGTGRNAPTSNINGIRFTNDGSHWLQTSSGAKIYQMWLSNTNSDNDQVWYLKSSDFGAYELSMDPSHNPTKKMGIYNGRYIGYHGDPSSYNIYLLPITTKFTARDAKVKEWGEHGLILEADMTDVASATMNVADAEPAAATLTAVNATSLTAGRNVKIYNADVTIGAVANEGKQLYVHWKNSVGTELAMSQIEIPRIIASSRDMKTDGEPLKSSWKDKEVHLLPGATLTANTSSYAISPGTASIGELHIYPGATLKVSTGTLTASTLCLHNGWTRAGEKEYDVARVYIADDAALAKDTAWMDYDIYEKSDGKHYYPLAVPFKTKVSKIDYADTTLAKASIYGKHIGIDKYDGENRAESGATADNWVPMGESDYLEPGKGYTITAVSSKGSAVIRVPVEFTNTWTADGEKATIDDKYFKNKVDVVAYTGAATSGGTANTRHAGWNLLGVPYMSCFASKNNATHDKDDAFITGKMSLTGDSSDPYGGYEEDDYVVYVTVPTHDFSEYMQYDITDNDTKLLPGWCFFIQFAKSGTLTFAVAGQQENSSLPIYAPKRENMPIVKTGIILSRGEKSDKTTLLINDKYSTEYEIGADLEKMFGNGYTLATYSLSHDTRLAYNAMSTEDAKKVIPIGFRAPEDGEYTFSLNSRYAEAAVERVDLIDYQTGEVTNLMMSNYTFTTGRTQDDERFALNVVPMAKVPTGMEDTDVRNQRSDVRKIILDDKMYIIYDGLMYDATGKRVTEINK